MQGGLALDQQSKRNRQACCRPAWRFRAAISSARLRRRHGVAEAGHGAGLGDFAVTHGPKHFEHFAPGRERAAIVALVLVHRLHEVDFVVVVVALAGGRIDLPAALALIAAVFAAAALESDRDRAFAAVVAALIGDAEVGIVAHGGIYLG